MLITSYIQAQILGLNVGTEVDLNMLDPGVTTSFPVVLKNSSGNTAAVGIIPQFTSNKFHFLGGAYPGIGGNCGQGLTPNQTCTLMLESIPASVGDFDEVLKFEYSLLSIFGTYPPPIEKTEIKIDGYSYPSSCSLKPEVLSVGNQNIIESNTELVEVSGYNFSPTTTVNVPGLSISNLVINDFNSLQFNITAGTTLGSYNMIIGTECGSVTSTNAITVIASPWIDLRTAAGVTQADPEYTTARITGYTIDTNFGFRINNNSNGWNKAVKFKGACDSISRSFDIVIYRTGITDRTMVGLLNQASVINPYPSGNSYQHQYIGFWNSGNASNTMYGTESNAGGSNWSQSIGTHSIATGKFYRYHFEQAGQAGQILEIWEVDANFIDIAKVGSTAISTKASSPASTVCAGLAPYDSGNVDFYVTGIKVE